MSDKLINKEFELHNGKGVLRGRYSTEEYQKAYKKLLDCIASCNFYSTMSAKEISETHGYTFEQAIDLIELETRKCLGDIK